MTNQEILRRIEVIRENDDELDAGSMLDEMESLLLEVANIEDSDYPEDW